MRMAKEEEKSVVIKIHERHIASVVVVGRWLGGRRGWRMEVGWEQRGRENWDKQHRFYSSLGIISGSRRYYIVLTLSGLPNYSSSSLPPPLSVALSLSLEKYSFTLFVVSRLSFSLGRFSPVTIFLSLSFRKKKTKKREDILSRLM